MLSLAMIGFTKIIELPWPTYFFDRRYLYP